MPLDFGGFASGFAGGMPEAESRWQRVMAVRQALQDAQRQRQAQAAFFASLTTPDAQMLPQQGPPGFQSMAAPSAAPSPAPAPIPAGALSPNATASAPPAPGGAPPGAAPPAGGSPPAPAGGINIPDPTARLRAMAMSLKRANPGMDDLTLATALEQQVNMTRGLAPDDRAMLQAETQIMRIEAQSQIAAQRAQSAIDAANIRAQAAQEVADIRAQVATRGQDIASKDRETAETGRNTRAAASEAGKSTRAQQRIDAANVSGQVKSQAKALLAERQKILDDARATGGIPTGEQKAQLDAVNDKIIKFWSANPGLPRASELVAPQQAAAPAQASGAASGENDPLGIR